MDALFIQLKHCTVNQYTIKSINPIHKLMTITFYMKLSLIKALVLQMYKDYLFLKIISPKTPIINTIIDEIEYFVLVVCNSNIIIQNLKLKLHGSIKPFIEFTKYYHNLSKMDFDLLLFYIRILAGEEIIRFVFDKILKNFQNTYRPYLNTPILQSRLTEYTHILTRTTIDLLTDSTQYF